MADTPLRRRFKKLTAQFATQTTMHGVSHFYDSDSYSSSISEESVVLTNITATDQISVRRGSRQKIKSPTYSLLAPGPGSGLGDETSHFDSSGMSRSRSFHCNENQNIPPSVTTFSKKQRHKRKRNLLGRQKFFFKLTRFLTWLTAISFAFYGIFFMMKTRIDSYTKSQGKITFSESVESAASDGMNYPSISICGEALSSEFLLTDLFLDVEEKVRENLANEEKVLKTFQNYFKKAEISKRAFEEEIFEKVRNCHGLEHHHRPQEPPVDDVVYIDEHDKDGIESHTPEEIACLLGHGNGLIVDDEEDDNHTNSTSSSNSHNYVKLDNLTKFGSLYGLITEKLRNLIKNDPNIEKLNFSTSTKALIFSGQMTKIENKIILNSSEQSMKEIIYKVEIDRFEVFGDLFIDEIIDSLVEDIFVGEGGLEYVGDTDDKTDSKITSKRSKEKIITPSPILLDFDHNDGVNYTPVIEDDQEYYEDADYLIAPGVVTAAEKQYLPIVEGVENGIKSGKRVIWFWVGLRFISNLSR